MTDRNTKYGAWPYLLLLLLAAIWGSSFILMKIGLFGWSEEAGPVMNGVQLGQTGFLRFLGVLEDNDFSMVLETKKIGPKSRKIWKNTSEGALGRQK